MNIKKHFPIFQNYPDLVYLDNAASSHKPQVLIDALSFFYSNHNSNIGRGVYKLAELAQTDYDESKEIISRFFSCKAQNVVYTSGATESLNLASHISAQFIKNKKYIVLPITEHHANVLIWQKLAEKLNLQLYWVEQPELIENPLLLPPEVISNCGIFAFAHVSNVTGEVFPAKKWCNLAKQIGAITVIDGSQAVTSLEVDLQDLDCDLYAFSAHKLYGPMGLGVLIISEKLLNATPLKLGGGIIEDVSKTGFQLLEETSRFEAGTPNVANSYAFAQTLKWLESNDWSFHLKRMHELTIYLWNSLKEIPEIKLIEFNRNLPKTHICSFSIENIHAHDIGTFLAKFDIAVRVGKQCTYPLHEHLKINSSVRASIGLYNSEQDIDKLVIAVKECIKYFS